METPSSESLSSVKRGLLTRREVFLRAGQLTAAAAIASLLDAPDAEAAELAPKLILGSGSLRYECIHDWLTPPATHKYGDTQGVVQDRKGNLYISHTVGGGSQSDDAVYVFDRKGKFLRSFGAALKGGGHGLDIRRESGKEFLYHCDTAHRKVLKTDLDGKVLWEIDSARIQSESGVYKNGANFIPTNVALAPNGDFYVTDGYGSNWVHQYNLEGKYIRTFGGTGTEAGKLRQPHGIWIDTRGHEPQVVVADRANNRLQYFTLDGQHVKFVSDGMRQPCHFDIQSGLLLVPDLSSVVTILDENNKVAAVLGDGASGPDLRGKPTSEFIPGKFVHPHSAKFLKGGDILVVEWVPQGRVTLLKKVK